jgi:hypothetical protein
LSAAAAHAHVVAGRKLRVAQHAAGGRAGHRPRGYTAGPSIGTHCVFFIHFIEDLLVRSFLPRYSEYLGEDLIMTLAQFLCAKFAQDPKKFGAQVSVCVSVRLSCLSVRLSVCSSVCLSACLSVCLPVCALSHRTVLGRVRARENGAGAYCESVAGHTGRAVLAVPHPHHVAGGSVQLRIH